MQRHCECSAAHYNFMSYLCCLGRRLMWRWGRKLKMLLSMPPQILNPNWKNCATTSLPTIRLWRCAAQTRGQNSSLLAKALHQPTYPIIYSAPCQPRPSHIHKHLYTHYIIYSKVVPQTQSLKNQQVISVLYILTAGTRQNIFCASYHDSCCFFVYRHQTQSKISGFIVVPSEETFTAIFPHWGFFPKIPYLFIFFIKNIELLGKSPH